jgi:fatty acid desaturase
VIFITDIRAQSLYHALIFNHQRSFKMKCNSGTADRVIRVIAGLALIALAASGTIGIWGYIGIVPLLTGVVGFCPAYTLFGMNTCGSKK